LAQRRFRENGTGGPHCRSQNMTSRKAGADTGKFKMKPKPGSPPGLETDGKGNTIPLAERTEDDQAKARAAGEDEVSMKDPEQEAEHPAPMPHSQQGQGGNKGGKKRDTDPAGQQGGDH
jgi:hypothetical protein